jgi:hypothetical protein
MEAFRMDAKKRGTFLAAALCAVLLGISAGCGSDDDDGGDITPGDGNVRDGTWRITTTTVFTGGSEICEQETDTTVELATICNLEHEFEQGLEGSPIPVDCDFSLKDVSYDVDCSGSLNVNGCTFYVTLTGLGEYHETSYDFDGFAVVSVTGPPVLCGSAPPCTLTIHEEGVWESATADCADDSTAAPAILAGGLRRLLAGL